ncbi:MAG TPA: class I SAM-dependent methyltransferase [Chthoniobacteraceae bacterium]|nr:class I SAM-dependent methyltransferase [Chthoniobacteraceae bacterium]
MNRWISPGLLAAFDAEATTAHRLFTTEGAWVERLGEDVLFSLHEGVPAEPLAEGFREWEAQSGFVSKRVFCRVQPKRRAEWGAPELLEGDGKTSLQTVVSEAGVRYGLDFGAGYSTGLFLDQRANRAFLRELAPKRLLNTFAYTCSFSVVAALAGAETLSLDLSKRSLERGRQNFALNALNEEGHRWIADDVLDVLPRLSRRGEVFDAIILDPPTFSRGRRGKPWQVERGLEELVLQAVEIAAPGAAILVSTNCTRLNLRTLESIVRFALRTHRRSGEVHVEPTLPDFPEEEGAQALWVRLK